jgi:hypothetical protein
VIVNLDNILIFLSLLGNFFVLFKKVLKKEEIREFLCNKRLLYILFFFKKTDLRISLLKEKILSFFFKFILINLLNLKKRVVIDCGISELLKTNNRGVLRKGIKILWK